MNMDGINFKAILHSVRIDKEGESRVTLSVPQSDLDNVMLLATETEKLILISAKVEEETD